MLDNPAALCRQLAAGELDVALVSSFEFLRNPIYRIVDDVSISSDGPVYSVVVAHREEIAQVNEIELDPASGTSINLLKHLLGATRVESAPGCKIDIVGRRAIAHWGSSNSLSPTAPEWQFWDLGEEWTQIVDLPFVYALWLVRPEVVDAKPMAERLRAVRDDNLAKIDKLIAQEKEFDPEFCRRYYREHLRFSFGEREKEGLQTFANACAKQDLIPKRVLEFNLVSAKISINVPHWARSN